MKFLNNVDGAKQILQDSNNRFVTDTEKATWNANSANDILTKIKTVDGTGSGLDADTLDGLQATAFATSAQGTLADNATPNTHVGTGGTAHADVTTTVDGFMSAADKVKLNGIATSANNYTHPTGAGNKHIPTAGASGQVLKWSSSGVAVWGTDKDTVYTHPSTHPSTMITGLPTSLPANGGNSDTVDGLHASAFALVDNGIVLSGSNANGYYIKYGDGTMICWYKTYSTYAIASAWGSLYCGPYTYWTFPVAFIAQPVVTGAGSQSTHEHWLNIVISTESQAGYYSLRPSTSASGVMHSQLMAIGRWK